LIVIDASVAAKWFFPERGTEAALELMDGPYRLMAPELIRLEVLSAITRRVRVGQATEAEAQTRCQKWLNQLHEGAISLISEADVLAEAVDLSTKQRHPLADCLYLAAARRFDAELITADKPFRNRMKPVYGKITLLTGCESN
jgi:predicted nucleic acid-binding protein